ncbi:MAG: UvrD-helicase domain-containing protein [Clostridia bacterium]|nr:UvrD-helicase domain-containing protein [Clostridia bacterium]
MDWTREQKRAIEARGTDILVAAGAGSGKTAVLVNRIAKAVLDREDPCDVDSLLVVTFTRAAADEMRSRLFRLMDERLASTDDPSKISRIYDQQVRLQRSWITTIDSFCKKVLTENMQESGIDASYAVCDDALRSEMLSEAVREAAEKFSDEMPEQYASLLDTYGGFYSDARLLEYIEGTVNFSLSFPDPDGWLRKCAHDFCDEFPDNDFAKTAYGRWLIFIVRLKFRAQLGELEKLRALCEEYGITNGLATLDEDIDILRSVSLTVEREGITWNEAFSACAGIAFPRMKTASKAEREARDPETVEKASSVTARRRGIINEIRDKTLKKLFSGAADSASSDCETARENVETFISLVRTSLEMFAAAKAEKHLYDYGDMEHMCLNILLKNRPSDIDAPVSEYEPSDLAISYRKRFSEIYVDEYQDTNMLQELILRLISGDGSDGPRMFMVGDMKQSIYSFRNACPELFTEKYSAYTDNDQDNRGGQMSGFAAGNACSGELIRLNANFRSRESVIDSVNMVFSKLMNNVTCGMPYGPDEYLNFGGNYYPSHEGTENATEIVVIDPGDSRSGPDKTELEAFEIMRRIKEMIAGGFKIFDTDAKAERPVRYSDICILMRSISPHGGKLAELLRSGGVPVKDTDDRAGLFSHPEVRIIISFMRVLDNPLNDIPLVSVLKNVYGFTGDMFVKVRLGAPEKDIPFYRRMKRICENIGANGRQAEGGADHEADRFTEAVAAFIDRLEALRTQCYRRPASETLWECLGENGFIDRVSSMNDGGAAYSNIMRIVMLTSEFDNSGGGSFSDYVLMLETLEAKGRISSSSPAGTGLNAVAISSIHKSKGLEYPVVFLAEAGRGRNTSDEKTRMIMHKELGLGPSCFDKRTRTVYPSVMKEAVRLRISRDSRAEEMRLLYVAMTRAREKLVITGVGGDFDEFRAGCLDMLDPSGRLPMDYYTLEADDYLTLLGMAALCKDEERGNSVRLVPGLYAKELLDASAEESGPAEDGANEDGSGGDFYGFIVKFGFPEARPWDHTVSPAEKQQGDTRICPSKASVSELKRLAFENDTVSEEPAQDRAMELYGGSGTFRMFGEPEEQTGDERKTSSAAERGTLLHCCLEHADFDRIKEISGDREKASAYASELTGELVKRRFISEDDAKNIPMDTLALFIRSDFARRMAEAQNIMREIPFSADYPSEVLFREPAFSGSTTVVQGIIDCVCVKDGKVTLIDYKSDAVGIPGDRDFEDHSRRYAVQLSVYSDVLRRAFGRDPDRVVLYYLRYGKEFEVTGEMIRRWMK